MLEKSFDKKTGGKVNYRTKIFITKIYSNIDKGHIILALLASFDKNRAKDRKVIKPSAAYALDIDSK